MLDSVLFSLIMLCMRDAWRCLSYERSRAPSFVHALRLWWTGQWCRIRRIRRLGLCRSAELWAAEAACARAGLAVSRDSASLPDGVCAPWHLPESALRRACTDWLVHPLIELEALPASAAIRSGPTALREHLELEGHGPPWDTVAVCGRDPLIPSSARLAVVLHLYYPELWPEVHEALQALPEPWDLFVTVPSFAGAAHVGSVVAAVPHVRFLSGPNRGRDVLPWLRLLNTGELDGYEWVCKLHTKRSPHLSDGNRWRQQLLSGLLGAPGQTGDVLDVLRAQPLVGVAGPASALIAADHPSWAGSSARAVQRVRQQLGLPACGARDPYFAGTMFWFRPQALVGLKRLGRTPAAFQPEFAQVDGTTAHAVERLIVTVAIQQGFELLSLSCGEPAPVAFARPSSR